MSIMFFTYRLGYNQLLYWDKLLEGLKKKYDSFRVITATDAVQSSNNVVSTEKGISGYVKYSKTGSSKQKFYFIPTPFFIRIIIRTKPKLIILSEYSLISFYIVLFKFMYSKTKIIQLVESDPYFGYDSAGFKKYLTNTYRNFISSHVDIIQTNNKIGYNYLVNKLKIKSENIVVKPYITSEVVKSKEFKVTNPNSNLFNILVVGRLIEMKGIQLFLAALKELPSETKLKLKVTIIGEGPIKNDLIKQVKENDLNFVEFLGSVKYEEIGNYFHNANCFVNSTLKDYRGLVGFEALSAGLPILMSKYDGARFEVVEENENGFIIDPYDTKKFTTLLNTLINNKALVEKFSNKSKGLASSFTSERCLRNLTETIDLILSK